MERLTDYSENGYPYMKVCHGNCGEPSCQPNECKYWSTWEKLLAEYEDIGLTPAEIKERLGLK